MKKLIVIAGPTASGKTDLGIHIAQHINGAIVSADSRQVYRDMDIGTGKPLDLGGVPHYLFDVVNPDEEFTVAHFKERALAAIHAIEDQGKIPMLVGGTGLYIRTITENLEIPAVPPNESLRTQFEQEYIQSPDTTLKEWGDKLRALDPDADIDFQNSRRLVRALEIVTATGLPLNQAQKKGPHLFDVLELGIEVPREELHARIDRRVDAMIALGLEDEVRGLLKTYPNFFSLQSSESPGYAEWQDYFAGTTTKEQAIEKIKTNTHAYARRQMTWFKKHDRMQWIRSADEALKKINDFLI